MPVAAIAGIGSALIGSSSAKKAARAQERSADQQMQLQREMYDQTREDLGGYRDAGDLARQAYMYEMGLGPAPMVGGTIPQIETITTPGSGASEGQINSLRMRALMTGNSDTRDAFNAQADRLAGQSTPGSTTYRVGGQSFNTMEDAQAWANANPTGGQAYGGFTATPGYQFRVDQGNNSINALAGARGGLMSGRTLQDLASFNQNIASDEYGNYINRLAGLTDMGSSAAAGQAGANNALAAQGSNTLGQRGNATAAGHIGVGNALMGGINTGIGIHAYQQGLNQNQGGFMPNMSGWRP